MRDLAYIEERAFDNVSLVAVRWGLAGLVGAAQGAGWGGAGERGGAPLTACRWWRPGGQRSGVVRRQPALCWAGAARAAGLESLLVKFARAPAPAHAARPLHPRPCSLATMTFLVLSVCSYGERAGRALAVAGRPQPPARTAAQRPVAAIASCLSARCWLHLLPSLPARRPVWCQGARRRAGLLLGQGALPHRVDAPGAGL